MRKMVACLAAAALLVLLTSCGTLGIPFIPKGELILSSESPAGDYTLNMYLCNGGATVDFAIRGELLNHKNNMEKNIYWGYHESDADVAWINETEVEINGRRLNIHKDVYDFRKEL